MTTASLPPYQRGRWLERQLAVGGPAAAVRTLRVEGPIDGAVLRRRLDVLVAGHPALRTTFAAGDDGPVAIVHDPAPADLRLERAADGADVAGRLRSEVPGTMVRARLFELPGGERVLALVADPVALDHRSLALLARALLTGEGLPVPLDGARGPVEDERLWAYWSARLAGELGSIDLGAARDGVAGAGATAAVEVGGVTASRLRRLAAGAGQPVHAALLLAVQLLLRRYTGVPDVVIGLPVALGPAALGWHTNTVVLRQDLSADAPARTLLGATGAALAGALDHAALPLDLLVRRLAPARVDARGPVRVAALVDALIAPGGDELTAALALGADGAETALGDLRVRPLALVDAAPGADLELRALTAGERLRVTLAHDPGRLPRPLVDCLRRDLLALLDRLGEEPDRPALGLLERSAIEAARGPDPGSLHPPDAEFVAFPAADLERSIPARFLDQARGAPVRTAVVTAEGDLTYAALAGRAAAAARAIREACGPAGERVGLLLDHGASMIAAILGALAAGRTYVPLDPSYPEERLAFMLAHSGATALVVGAAHRDLAHRLCARGGRPRLVDASSLGTAPAGDLEAPVAAGTPAYVLYTSGSTGRPKGVVQDHRNVLFQVRRHTNDHRISPGDRLSLVSSFCFDASVTDLFGALLNGAAVVPFDTRGHGVARLAAALAERRVTVLHATPTVYRHLLAGEEALPAIRLVLLGGEEVTWEDVRLCRRRLPDRCVLVNGYGATEVSFALRNPVAATDAVGAGAIPLGWPLDGVEVGLLGPDGRPACLRGEIEVRSRHVALGYLGDEDATRERFGTTTDGTRRYRTGDLGRRLPDGRVVFAGRRDRQAKVRGHRVEPGEIEAALAASPSVAQVAAVPAADGVVAYVVAADGCRPEPAGLRGELERKLPYYLVPTAVVVLDTLPLTPTGKVDVGALPPPARAGGGGANGLSGDGVEGIIAGAWRAVLGRDDFGPEDAFFDLGGHSLLMAGVQRRVERALGVDLPLHRLFEHPTVGSLARYLRGQDAGAAEKAVARVQARMGRRRSARSGAP